MTYSRIASANERVHDLLLEAVAHGCYVFAHKSMSRVVITKKQPSRDYEKLHGGVRGMQEFTGPEAA
jgi:hypothetical protein